MKMIDKLINKIEEMLEKANKQADYCKGVPYDEGFYVGKGEAFEEVLKLLEKNKKLGY